MPCLIFGFWGVKEIYPFFPSSQKLRMQKPSGPLHWVARSIWQFLRRAIIRLSGRLQCRLDGSAWGVFFPSNGFGQYFWSSNNKTMVQYCLHIRVSPNTPYPSQSLETCFTSEKLFYIFPMFCPSFDPISRCTKIAGKVPEYSVPAKFSLNSVEWGVWRYINSEVYVLTKSICFFSLITSSRPSRFILVLLRTGLGETADSRVRDLSSH